MKITSKPCLSEKSLSDTVSPSTLGSEKSGARSPRARIVDAVFTMTFFLMPEFVKVSVGRPRDRLWGSAVSAGSRELAEQRLDDRLRDEATKLVSRLRVSQLGDLLDQTARDVRIFFAGHQEHRLNVAGQHAIGQRHREFALDVGQRPHAAEHDRGSAPPHEVDRESGKALDVDIGVHSEHRPRQFQGSCEENRARFSGLMPMPTVIRSKMPAPRRTMSSCPRVSGSKLPT